MTLHVDAERLLDRIRQLGQVGRGEDGSLTRLAASDADKAARDVLTGWIEAAGLEVAVDRLGNLFGIWRPVSTPDMAPVMIGSHIDTVVDAGVYDGCYGVLAGLEVLSTLKRAGFEPSCPMVVAAFTNEEGVRYAPDMMGSLVFAGGLAVEEKKLGTEQSGALDVRRGGLCRVGGGADIRQQFHPVPVACRTLTGRPRKRRSAAARTLLELGDVVGRGRDDDLADAAVDG